MKKFIVNALLFFLFTGLFYMVSLFLWGSYAPSMFKPNINYRIGSYGHMYSRLSEVKSRKNLDILFLGSSHAYREFDTRIFSHDGLSTFNLGSSSQTHIQTKLLLERYLDKLNPKLVIYEVFPEIFMSDGVESSLDVIANDKNDLLSLMMALKINNIKTYNTFLYGVMRDALGLNDSYVEPVSNGADKYISGGFVEKEVSYFKPIEFESRVIALRQEQLESFSETVSMLKKRNIELILVYAPIPHCNYKRYSNNSYFDSLMTSYSKYYNFNEIMSLNDSVHFSDSNHLNQKGIELFDKKLIEILNEKKVRIRNSKKLVTSTARAMNYNHRSPTENKFK
jgi:hypothetical protein